MDEEGNVANTSVSQISGRGNQNHNGVENPLLTERYTKLPDTPPSRKLPALDSNNPSKKSGILPPLHNQQPLDSDKYPLNAARLEYMPQKLSTPTPSIAGSLAGSSIRSDMSRTRYEAESPDELALVRAASTYNCCLKGRTAKSVTVWLPGMWTLAACKDLVPFY